MDNSIGVYIHIPFCKSKCYYCDFNSFSGREHLAGSYFSALEKEIVSRSGTVGNRRVSSIFIGGGTPSLVDPEHIRGLMKVCSKHLQIDKDAEISMESNPGTLDYQRLKQYREMGINRLSVGLQAWQDNLLRSIGRIHSRQQFIDNLKAAVQAGFDNINVDLIFGLPGQTFEDWTETIEEITALNNSSDFSQERETCPGVPKWNTGPVPVFHNETRGQTPCFIKHVSCYSLKIEEGTVLGDRLKAGTLAPAEDELDRRMYHYAVETLGKKGYGHYEISNFAVPGYESKHNLVYWKAREYAGFGSGAHSYLNSVRFSNVSGIEEYIAAVGRGINETGNNRIMLNMRGDTAASSDDTAASPGDLGELFEDEQFIDKNEAMSEYMILGLRLTGGITSVEFKERFGEVLEEVYGDKLHKLISKGLLSSGKNCIDKADITYKLTSRGLDLANSVFVEFI